MTNLTEREKQIAAGLTEAQRKAVLSGVCSHEVLVSAEMEPLWFSALEDALGVFSIRLTTLGLAIRNHLTENRDDQ